MKVRLKGGDSHPRWAMALTVFASLLDNSHADRVGRVGLMMPITDGREGNAPVSQSFLSITCAAKLAVRHVNEGIDTVVPGLRAQMNLTNLEVTLYNTGLSESPAIVSYRKLLADGRRALVGAARSAVSTPLAQLGKIDRIPQCSYWSSAPALSNKLLYPYCAQPDAPLPCAPLCDGSIWA